MTAKDNERWLKQVGRWLKICKGNQCFDLYRHQ